MSNRREFLTRGLTFAGTAGALASALAPRPAFARTQGGAVRRADRYDDSFIFERINDIPLFIRKGYTVT